MFSRCNNNHFFYHLIWQLCFQFACNLLATVQKPKHIQSPVMYYKGNLQTSQVRSWNQNVFVIFPWEMMDTCSLGPFFFKCFFLLEVTAGLSKKRCALVETFHSIQPDLNNSCNAPWVKSVQQHITWNSPDGRHGGFCYSNSSLKEPFKRCDELRGMRLRQAASEVWGIDL